MADKIRGQGPEGEMMGDTPDFTDEDLEGADYLLDRRAQGEDGRLPRWGAATGIGGRHVDPPMTSHGRAGSSDPALARLSAFPGSSLPHFRVDVNSPPRFSSIDINEFEGAVQAGGLEGGLVLFHPFRVHGVFL